MTNPDGISNSILKLLLKIPTNFQQQSQYFIYCVCEAVGFGRYIPNNNLGVCSHYPKLSRAKLLHMTRTFQFKFLSKCCP